MCKIILKNTFLHLKKIFIHKYWVAHYCFRCGLYWQGITHDLSKFSPVEFLESVKYYQGDGSPINACKADKGYSLAWQHHKGRNPHHYEHWTDNYDSGTTCIPMPKKYAVEMFCDYLGAARAYLGKKFTFECEMEWWNNKWMFGGIKMHADTVAFVTNCFTELYELELKYPGNISKIENLFFKTKYRDILENYKH